jgi:L-alanine-DL-glutamate epimerase-like enolase superfamily enzyme
MKITQLRSLRLLGPRVHSLGGKPGLKGKLIVRIDTDAGIHGLGEAEDFLGVREALAWVGEHLAGRDPLAVRPFVSEMLHGTLPPHPPPVPAPDGTVKPGRFCGPTCAPVGPILWGLSGVEMALCDLAGKILGTPVYNLLGGAFRDAIRIYLDRSAPADVADLDAWRKLAAETVAAGYTRLKFDADFAAPDRTQDVWNRTLARGQLARIAERFGAVRTEIGPEVELAVDCHMQFNTGDAIQLAQELAPLKLMWLEDPTPIANPDAVAQVRAKSPMPICVGEMFSAEQARLFIDRQACDVIHPDVLFAGGLHETHRIADYAELHQIPLALHGNGGCLATIAAAHVAAASRGFMGLEYHFIESDWLGRYVRREGVPFLRDGVLPLTDAPGLGVELDEDVCRRRLAPGESLF